MAHADTVALFSVDSCASTMFVITYCLCIHSKLHQNASRFLFFIVLFLYILFLTNALDIFHPLPEAVFKRARTVATSRRGQEYSCGNRGLCQALSV